MLRKLLVLSAAMTPLALPATSFAEIQNMVGAIYQSSDNDADEKFTGIGILGTHYLAPVDTSGLVLEAPFMQRAGSISAAYLSMDMDLAGTDGDASVISLEGMMMVPQTDLYIGLELARQDASIDGFTDMELTATGIKVGYYLQKYTAVSLGVSKNTVAYDPEFPAFGIVDYDETIVSVGAETLIYSDAGPSFKFGAEIAKTSNSEDADSDTIGVKAAYFPTGRIGVRLGMEQIRYDVSAYSDEQTLSLGLETYLEPGVFLAVNYAKESESGSGGVDGDSLQLVGAMTF